MKSTTIAEPQAVDDVAERPAQHERESHGEHPLPHAVAAAAARSTISRLTPSARPVKNQRCQPPAAARKLNAAPRLCGGVMSSTGSSERVSYSSKWRVIQLLDTWSAAMLASVSPTTAGRCAPERRCGFFAVSSSSARMACLRSSGIPTGFGRPSMLPDAARAQFRMFGAAADIAVAGASSARTWSRCSGCNADPHAGDRCTAAASAGTAPSGGARPHARGPPT